MARKMLNALKKKGGPKTLLLVLLAFVIGLVTFRALYRKSGRVETYNSCSAGKHYDARQKKCVCNPGTEWDSAKKMCMKPTVCSAGKQYDPRQKKCVCNPGTEWDSAKKMCVKPRVKKTWKNVTINRFGSYQNYGQGQGRSGTVACTDKFPKGHSGIWTAINPQVMGFGSTVPCGTKLRVTDPKTGKSQEVVVMDGGGSDGLDIDDIGYRNIVPKNYDGKRKGYTVEQLA